MISLISYLGESWRERRWVILKRKKQKKKQKKTPTCERSCEIRTSLTNATCGIKFPKMAPSVNHALHYLCSVYSWFLASGRFCDLHLTDEIWQKWHCVTSEAGDKTLCISFPGLLKHSLFGHFALGPSCHIVRSPSHMERTHTGAPMDSPNWAPSQHQPPALWMSHLGLSAQLSLQTTPNPATIWLQDEIV